MITLFLRHCRPDKMVERYSVALCFFLSSKWQSLAEYFYCNLSGIFCDNSLSKMLDNFFKGDIPSIFETTIKREKGRTSECPSASKLKDYRNEEEFLKSVKATICYCGSFWTFGMAAALIGPTLLELGCVTNRPVNIMSWVFFSQALSALFGSSIGGFLADRYGFHSLSYFAWWNLYLA